MHILITGATGLIGKEIIKCCIQKGYRVNYLTTNRSKIEKNATTTGFFWNPSSGEIDLNCFEGVNAIVNLAGATISKKWTSKYKKEIISSRIQSITLLKKGLNKVNHKINSIVTASAIGIYPNSYDNYYNELETNVDDSFLGEVVNKWERKADILAIDNIKVSKIRIGLVLSDQGGALPQIIKPVKLFVGTIFGNGKQWQSWIHINDLARLFLFVIENKFEGIYNGVTPSPVTNKELIEEISKTLKKPLLLPNVPQFIMKLILGEMSYLLFASQKVSSKKIEDLGFHFNYPDLESSLQTILKKSPHITN